MQFEEVYTFIPYLKELIATDGGFHYINNDDNGAILGTFPSVQFSEELNDFIESLHNTGVIKDSYREIINFYYPNQSFKSLTFNDLENAPIEIIAAFITYLVRQDRFVDGLLKRAIKDGTMLKLIEILQIKDIK